MLTKKELKLLKKIEGHKPIHEGNSLHVFGNIYAIGKEKISVFNTIGDNNGEVTIEVESINEYHNIKDTFENNLEEFYRHAMDTWTNSLKLQKWLNEKNQNLNGLTPIEFAISNENLYLLNRLLYKIEFTSYFWERN